MQNKQYKKLQRKMNRAIRHLNENIANDDLWKGRFYAHQTWAAFGTYEDKSGVTAIVEVAFIDKLTEVVYKTFLRANDILGISWWSNKFSNCGYQLWHEMNDFVCNQTKGLNFKEYRVNAIDFTNDKRWSK